MVITEFEKRGCREETVRLLKEGKLVREACSVCGRADARVVHLDWSDPRAITWLCRVHRGERQLSDLQRALLREALLAYENQPEDDEELPSFRLDLNAIADPRKRESRRAASGLALKRLIRRGLIGRCGYGQYSITPDGVDVAKRLLQEHPHQESVASASPRPTSALLQRERRFEDIPNLTPV
jgi:hypothetical protein